MTRFPQGAGITLPGQHHPNVREEGEGWLRFTEKSSYPQRTMADWPDEKIRNIAVWHIEKASIDPATWRCTLIGKVHPTVAERILMQEGELPIVSSFISDESWYLFTTRRLLGTYGGQRYDALPAEILQYEFGNFKGYGHEETAVMNLKFPGGREVELEYETGRASMAPIHYLRFWELKYPVLDKLRFDPRPFCPHCGKPLRTAEARQCVHCGADWHGKDCIPRLFCPYCGKPLRTADAQQCVHCGADWHRKDAITR